MHGQPQQRGRSARRDGRSRREPKTAWVEPRPSFAGRRCGNAGGEPPSRMPQSVVVGSGPAISPRVVSLAPIRATLRGCLFLPSSSIRTPRRRAPRRVSQKERSHRFEGGAVVAGPECRANRRLQSRRAPRPACCSREAARALRARTRPRNRPPRFASLTASCTCSTGSCRRSSSASRGRPGRAA